MTRLCVLGNSHVAALKKAWDEIAPAHPGLSVTFFASRLDGLRALRVLQGRLVPGSPLLASHLQFSSGGKDHIDPADYDAFLVHAAGFVPPELPASGDFSDRFVEACIARQFKSGLGGRLTKMLRAVTRKPVLVSFAPTTAAPDAASILQSFAPVGARVARLAAQHGLVFVPQPAETIDVSNHTKSVYSTGSRRLDVGDAISDQLHPESDLHHMNAEYGKLVLRDVFKVLAGV